VYRLKVKNASWFRSITDIHVRPRVLMWHDHGKSKTSRSLRIGSSPEDLHILRPRQHTIVTLFPGEMPEASVRALTHWGYSEAASSARSLEDLLALPSALMSVQVMATDGWTGGSHYLESPRYRAESLAVQARPFTARQRPVDKVIGRFHRRRAEMHGGWLRGGMLRSWHPELQPAQDEYAGAGEPPAEGASTTGR